MSAMQCHLSMAYPSPFHVVLHIPTQQQRSSGCSGGMAGSSCSSSSSSSSCSSSNSNSDIDISSAASAVYATTTDVWHRSIGCCWSAGERHLVWDALRFCQSSYICGRRRKQPCLLRDLIRDAELMVAASSTRTNFEIKLVDYWVEFLHPCSTSSVRRPTRPGDLLCRWRLVDTPISVRFSAILISSN